MTIIESVLSGVVQGLTEFLPVSSSGHLVLLHNFFGLSEPNIFFDICLHVGTLLAVILFFGKDIITLVKDKRVDWLFFIIIGTVPAVLAALFFENEIAHFFTDVKNVSFMLVVTAMILFAGQFALKKVLREGNEPLGALSSILVGIAQAFALIPGISRSGATISMGLLRKMDPKDAFRFSFLLSIPAILGATLYEGLKIDITEAVFKNLPIYTAGMTAAFIVGFFSLFLLWKFLREKHLYFFGIYCLILGVTGIIF